MGGAPPGGWAFPLGPYGMATADPLPCTAPLTREEIENKVRGIADELSLLEQAVMYHYLNAIGMDLHRAQTVKRKAGW
jgi:hypothetical protein